MVKARKLGGSLVVRIPKEIVENEGIAAGETVSISVKRVRKDWFGSLPDLSPMTKEDKLDEHDDY